jgi:hypothetical protein
MPEVIEVRIDTISQLFHTLDPYPFRDRDLDKDAEEFIVGWARELPRDQPLKIVIHIPLQEESTPAAHDLSAALNRYFSYRAQVVGFDLNELFRVGRLSLGIGLAVLSLCIIARQVVGRFVPAPLDHMIAESLLIFGWVANWRPIEIFLYDWWPVVRRRNLYARLGSAEIELRSYAPAASMT